MRRRRILLLALIALAVAGFLLHGGHESKGGLPTGGDAVTGAGAEPGLAVRTTLPTATAPMGGPEPEPEVPPAPAPETKGESGLISGLVLTAYGDPVARVQVDVDGRGLEFTNAWGAFVLAVPGPGTYTVRARLGGLFHGTVTEEVVVPAYGVVTRVRLRFPKGSSVQGRALLPDGRPAENSLIKITTTTNRMELSRMAEGIWSSTNARSWLACRADHNGEFGFAGLHPSSTYVLWWMGDDGTLVRHPEDVNAGQSDLRVEVRRHRVVVGTYDAETGEGIENDEWHIRDLDVPAPHDEDFDEQLNQGSAWDENHFITPPGRRLRVVAFSWGYEHVDTTYVVKDGWGAQEVAVRMKPLPGHGARLSFEARDPEGRVVQDMRFRRTYVDTHGQEVTDVGLHLIGPSGDWETRIPPCRLRVRTRGKETPTGWDDPSLLLLPATKTIDVPKSGDVQVQLDMARGGAAVLEFKAPKNPGHYRGGYLLETELRDEQGRVVPVRWSSLRASPGNPQSVLQTDGLVRSTALPAGRYRLKLYEDFESIDLRPVTVPVEIRQGKLTRVSVQLVRESEKDD